MYKAEKAYKNPDFMNSRAARPLRILSEYIEPASKMEEHNINHTVVFFGSARIKPDETDGLSHYYETARQFAFELAKYSSELKDETGDKFIICTGGGPGIMEAANRGASEAGEKTMGLNISLPFEQYSNPYITRELNLEFHYFFTRKLWLLYQAKAIIAFPGGFGTLDELFETLTLIQTKKMEKSGIPIMLFDSNYWNELINFKKLVDMGMISENDLDLFHFFDSVEEGMEFVKPRLKNLMATVDHFLP